MTDQVTLGFWLGSYVIYFTAVSILDQHGKKKTKKKMHYQMLVLLNSSAAVWKISYLFMKSNMVMNYSGIKQHTYLNILVKLVYELSYMYIQCTGGMVLKDLCWSESCRRPEFIMAYLTQFKLFNKVILYM